MAALPRKGDGKTGLAGASAGPKRRGEFATFIQSLTWGDPASLRETLLVRSSGRDVLRGNIERAAGCFLARHGDGPLVLSKLVVDMLPIMRQERLVIPLFSWVGYVAAKGVVNTPAVIRGLGRRVSVDAGWTRRQLLGFAFSKSNDLRWGM